MTNSSPLPATSQLAAWVAETYALQPVSLSPLREAQPDRQLLVATSTAGAQWSVRLLGAGVAVPSWVTASSTTGWLQQQDTILEWCAREQIRAPRLRRTASGDPIGTFAGWNVLVMEFVAGSRAPATPQSRQCAAVLLGQLHQRSATSADVRDPLPWSWWAPLPYAVRRAQSLFPSATALPAQWRPFVAACEAAVVDSQRLSDLPEALIHADVYLGNTICSAPNQCQLVDWEYAGRGLAVLDTGGLLSDCFHDRDGRVEADEASIAAALDGYSRFRRLSPAECDALPAAIRFGIAYRTAVRAHLGLRHGWDEGIEGGFRREQARFAASQFVSDTARRYLDTRRAAA